MSNAQLWAALQQSAMVGSDRLAVPPALASGVDPSASGSQQAVQAVGIGQHGRALQLPELRARQPQEEARAGAGRAAAPHHAALAAAHRVHVIGREPALRRDFDALKRAVGNEDALQITYELKSDHVRRVNDMLSIAEDLAGNGRGLAAFALRRKVGDILDDDEAYEVRKVTVLTKTSQKEMANRGNAILVSFDIVAETGMERAQVVWKVPAKPVAKPLAKPVA